MNILITGAKGFIGRNLVATLNNIRDGKDATRTLTRELNILEYDLDTDPALLQEYCAKADFVFHLAGVNRPKEESEFMAGNFGFTSLLLEELKQAGNTCPILLSSSIQAQLDNPYGKSKLAGEELLRQYGRETGSSVLIYRFPNVFGKWCRPNYNSAVATFCHNIARDLPITVSDRSTRLTLVYIDDVVDQLLLALEGKEHREGNFCVVPTTHAVTLGEIVDLLHSFRESRKTLSVADQGDAFTKKLYATYLSYLPEDGFSYPLTTHSDHRGSFTEIIRTAHNGQFSVNISKPGITKGQHWHNTKWEFFIVVSGHGLIQERRIGSDEVLNFEVSGEKLEAIHMLPGYTHNIINLSETEDLVTLMWANEQFDPTHPDTFFEVVEP